MGRGRTHFFYSMDVAERVNKLVRSTIENSGVELVDMSYRCEGKTRVLRVLVDKPGGISLGECSKISREISDKLDGENVTDENYMLEVSSPGLDRVLKNRSDFEWAIGRDLRVRTYAPINKSNLFVGRLLGINNDAVVIENKEGISTEIPIDKIAKGKLHVEF